MNKNPLKNPRELSRTKPKSRFSVTELLPSEFPGMRYISTKEETRSRFLKKVYRATTKEKRRIVEKNGLNKKNNWKRKLRVIGPKEFFPENVQTTMAPGGFIPSVNIPAQCHRQHSAITAPVSSFHAFYLFSSTIYPQTSIGLYQDSGRGPSVESSEIFVCSSSTLGKVSFLEFK